jgi:predicted dehydrogenase
MPQSVYATCIEGAYRNIRVENDVTVLARYPDGSHGVFTTCSHDLLGTDRLEISFEKGKIILEDNRKATILRYTQPEGSFGETYDFRTFYGVLMQKPQAIYTQETLTAETTFCGDYVQMFRNFADYLLHAAAPIAPAQAGLLQVQLANAIQLSGWTGQEVTLPGDCEHYNRLLAQKIQEEHAYSAKEELA